MSAGKVAMALFEARTAAHIMHLQTRSYATHKALDEFYHGVVEAADAYLEAYQGVYGIIKEYPSMDEFEDMRDPKALMTKLRNFLVTNREACCEGETELENLYDGLIDLVDSTTYKLRFLS